MLDLSRMGPLAYAERPLRRSPQDMSPDSDIYLTTPAERAALVQSAFDAGIRLFHAAHEREAASLGVSLQTLGLRDQISLSTTDGDALDRCPDTEEGGARAVRAALARKQELLQQSTIDLFLLYDFRAGTHTPARIAGAVQALTEAQAAGEIHSFGATCYGDYDALADALETGAFPAECVIARYNYPDQNAAARLFPLCQALQIPTLAAQPFAWYGGVPFIAFPNTWRYRNLTKNFYGFTAAQAHLYWIKSQNVADGILASMQTQAQVVENAGALEITKTPQGLESLFDSFVEAITTTRAGWRGLLESEQWEWRTAAEAMLGKSKKPS